MMQCPDCLLPLDDVLDFASHTPLTCPECGRIFSEADIMAPAEDEWLTIYEASSIFTGGHQKCEYDIVFI